MRFFNFLIVIFVSSSTLAFSKVFYNRTIQVWKTPNFEIRYRPKQTERTEAQIVGKKAETYFERLDSYLGQRPKYKLVISLEGNRGSDPKHKWAYVDDTSGGIHLFRFPEDTFAYQTGLSHELVHAYRFEHLSHIELPPSPAFVFLEEGIAEHLSNVIEPKKEAFSNYGYSPVIIAGQWIESNEDIPLETLLREQYHLRSLCIPQAYTQQASFIEFVEQELRIKTIFNLAFAKDKRYS